jgi:hypothetical protein
VSTLVSPCTAFAALFSAVDSVMLFDGTSYGAKPRRVLAGLRVSGWLLDAIERRIFPMVTVRQSMM